MDDTLAQEQPTQKNISYSEDVGQEKNDDSLKTQLLDGEKALTKTSEEKNEQQSNEKNKLTSKKVKSFNYQLDFQENDFYKSFSKPGDCIIKLFSDIKETTVFNSNNDSYDSLNLNIPKEIFKGDTINDACYSYHHKLDNFNAFQRVEIGVRGEKEGWVWMLASKPIRHGAREGGLYLYFKEFVLEKINSKWKINLGHEGEIITDRQALKKFQLANFWGMNNYKWFDNTKNEICNSIEKCSSDRSLHLFWKPNNKSPTTIDKISKNTEDQIIRWNNERIKEIYTKTWNDDWVEVYPRKRIYLNNKWHNQLGSYSDKVLIKWENKNVSKNKGKWENLVGFCEDNKNETSDLENYKLYCH